ncbi:TPR domain protein [Penicillium capsulatum]|uniref:TPR domain protein n=1 Tax=Penicillium capsulatum TaxID=69766 RepID=A0A9W9LYV0_9EURO|nr:TPR domain protein [Penicillium capsulatum]KAJ6130639.1 TPR domain protein [Penicillium capsulatum]
MKHPDASRRPFAHDPKCAMAFWGLTYATGPNYNKSWLMFDRDDLNKSIEKCHHAAKTALHLAQTESVTPVEMALIKAIQLRFPDAHPASDFSAVNDAYATAMFDVYQHFGADDLNVTTLYADALMHTALRKMFHVKTGLPIEDSPVHKVRNMFDIAFQNRAAETHCGLLHFWIHFINIPITSGPCMDTMSVY